MTTPKLPKVKISRKRCKKCGAILWTGRCVNHRCKLNKHTHDEENE